MDAVQINDSLSVARFGLRWQVPHSSKVIVVGAGMAGLVTAYELQRAGHDVTILEATQRVGGRVLTIRDPFADGLYAEAGAMRLPSSHCLTQAYIEKFGLQTYTFTKSSANAFFYLSRKKYLRSEVHQNPTCLPFEFADANSLSVALRRWSDFIHETVPHVTADSGYWNQLLDRYGDDSLYDFLTKQGWSTDIIMAFALVEGLESVLASSFLEVLRIEVQWLSANMSQIRGGMDLLPRAFLPELQNCIVFGAEMVALDYTQDSVTIHYRTRGGLDQIKGDFAILTIPYPSLRFVDVVQSFSAGKQMAIRQVHYVNSTKIFLQCRRRFWEEDDKIFGGATMTDLPNRSIYYPDHGRDTKRGILMAAFTYGEDANRWAALPPEERIEQAVMHTSKIHPQVIHEYEVGVSKVWGEDRFAGGACAFFEPGQEAWLYAHMITPEGPIHFGGEHTSLKHGWIEGAVESGLRAAQEVHSRALASSL
jgi:monoamine oxidase